MIHSSSKRGVTLTELAMVVAVSGVTLLMIKAVSQLLRDVSSETAMTQMSRESEIRMFTVAHDIRNASQIISVSSGSVSFRVFNDKLGYDTLTSSIFDDVTIGTITYQYKTEGGQSFLERHTIMPAAGGYAAVDKREKWLRNMLKEPVGNDYLFSSVNPPWATEIEGVDVFFRLKEVYNREGRVYQSRAMTRSRRS